MQAPFTHVPWPHTSRQGRTGHDVAAMPPLTTRETWTINIPKGGGSGLAPRAHDSRVEIP